MSNTHRAVIEGSCPPSMDIIAAGPIEFCQQRLADWTATHPLGEFDTPRILEVIE